MDHVAADLCQFIDASPSPFHVVAEVARRLVDAGFEGVREEDAWPDRPGGRFVVRGASIVAWRATTDDSPTKPFRVLLAHTDSPNLRLKPNPAAGSAGMCQLAVEVYGSPLLNSWLGRDLGISGRVALRSDPPGMMRLVRSDDPIAHLPQLAIHLDRSVNDVGLTLNQQAHLSPVVGLGAPSFDAVAHSLGIDPADLLAHDLMLHDLTGAAVIGPDLDMLAASRIDNLLSCHAAIGALLDAGSTRFTPVIALFDHEEVGSTSASGAGSTLLSSTLARITMARPGVGTDDFQRALGASLVASVDNAHATHPNYPERHEPNHRIALNGGAVIKFNANQRYATDAMSAAVARRAAEAAGVPLQAFVTRSDLACGSTVGPVVASELGVRTVDLGAPQLAMHSARELCGAADPGFLRRLLAALLEGLDQA